MGGHRRGPDAAAYEPHAHVHARLGHCARGVGDVEDEDTLDHAADRRSCREQCDADAPGMKGPAGCKYEVLKGANNPRLDGNRWDVLSVLCS